ncbi:MAG TPA: gliding motility-associated C-terminal domain-containing protein, partial [Bacteroidia bacterium]|nr:gliding motility-associated C-terminal domain-containing protein [Bacteroidia bacterium]
SATYAVTVNPAPTASVTGTNSICAGGSTTLVATGGGTYAWSSGGTSANETVSPSSTTTYSVIVTNASACSDTATITVTVNPLPNATITGGGNICSGQSITLSTPGTGNYSWSTGSTSSSISVSPSTTTTYSLTVTDPVSGCSSGSSATVTVLAPPVASITGISSVCAGGIVSLTASGGSSYAWSTGANSASMSDAPVAGTTYTVVVSNGSCTDTATFAVTVNPLPVISTIPDTTINYGQTITIGATSSPGSTLSWSPSSGLSCTTCASPDATPSATTTYCVLATDGNGCADTACVTIFVDINCGEVFVPNAFSPNNDSKNDVLLVMGNCVTGINFQVFDRWGEKVFESNDPSMGWDGTYNGKPLDAGVYVYQLEATLVTGDVVQKKGNISLIR